MSEENAKRPPLRERRTAASKSPSHERQPVLSAVIVRGGISYPQVYQRKLAHAESRNLLAQLRRMKAGFPVRRVVPSKAMSFAVWARHTAPLDGFADRQPPSHATLKP